MNYRSYLLPTLLALILHSVILTGLFYSWFGHAEDERRLVPRHVKAQIVDIKSQLKAQQQKQAEARKKEDARKQAEARKQQARKQEQARKKAEARKQEQARKQAEARKQEDARKKAEARKKADARKQEQARIAAEKKQQDEARRKEEARKQADLKEAERQAQERIVREQAEQQRREDEMAAALADEEAEMQAEAEQQSVAGFRDYIAYEIEQNWRRPPSARNGMKVLLTLHLLPTGEVDNVYVVTGSGNSHFDESAIRAVKRVGQFVELQGMDPVLFDRYYRKFNLEFNPTDLRR